MITERPDTGNIEKEILMIETKTIMQENVIETEAEKHYAVIKMKDKTGIGVVMTEIRVKMKDMTEI